MMNWKIIPNRRKFCAIIWIFLMICPISFILFQNNQQFINSNQYISISDINSELDPFKDESYQNYNQIFPSYEFSNEDLIDGTQIEIFENTSEANNDFNINLNNSMKTTGIFVNITDINQSVNLAENGEFNTDINSWDITEGTDINGYWHNEYFGNYGVSEVKLSGLEETKKYSIYNDSGILIDNITALGNWEFSNGTIPEDPEYKGTVLDYFALDQTKALQLEWSTPIDYEEGYRIGYLSQNFTYDGTDNVVNATLDFDYNFFIDGGMFSGEDFVGEINLSIYLVLPNGTERELDWTQNFSKNQTNANTKYYSDLYLQWSTVSINLTDYISQVGKYILKFKSSHFHGHYDDLSVNTVETRSMIDNIKLQIEYTQKSFKQGENASISQNSYIYSPIREDPIFQYSLRYDEPFEALNYSESEIFLSIQDSIIQTIPINQSNPEQWNNYEFQLDKTIFDIGPVEIEIGLNFSNNGLVIQPNESWSFYLDNISLNAEIQPSPEQINLKILFPSENKTFFVENENFGLGNCTVSNNSLIYFGEGEDYASMFDDNYNVHKLSFISNTTNTSISYSIIKQGLTWKDTIYTEFLKLSEDIQSYLRETQELISSSSFSSTIFKDFYQIINLTSLGDYEEAKKYCSLIDQQFPLIYEILISTLRAEIYNSEYNVYQTYDYFEDYNPTQILSMNSYEDIESVFKDILSLFDEFSLTEFAEGTIKNTFQALYGSYESSVASRLLDIKNFLISFDLNESELNLLNLSTIFYSLQDIRTSVDRVINGVSTNVNIDPRNTLLNWGSSESIDEIIFASELSDIYLGELTNLIKIIDSLYENTYEQSWKYSVNFEYIIPHTINSEEVTFDPNDSSMITLMNNPLGTFGYLPDSNLEKQYFPFGSETIVNDYLEPLEPVSYKKSCVLIESSSLIPYYLMLFLYEDQIVRKNCPTLMDYAYKSVLSIVEKTTNSSQDNNEFNQMQYTGDISINNPGLISNYASSYSDCLIRNTGTACSVKYIAKYYIITEDGPYFVNKQILKLTDLLNKGESLGTRIPIQIPDNLQLNNLIADLFGYENSSLEYYVIQEVYFDNQKVFENTDILINIPESQANMNSNVENLQNSINNSLHLIEDVFQVNPSEKTYILNISELYYENGNDYEDALNSEFSLIISKSNDIPSIKDASGIHLNYSLETLSISWNSTNNRYKNDFSSMSISNFDDSTIFLRFNPTELLNEVGLPVTKENFEIASHFTFGIGFNQYFSDYNISFVIQESLELTPIWFKELNVYATYNNYDENLEIIIPYIEISGTQYFKIISQNLEFDDSIFYTEYNIINPESRISGSYHNVIVKLYPRAISNNIDTDIRFIAELKLQNGQEQRIETLIHINIYQNYHFDSPITPNILITLLIGTLAMITLIFIKRIFKMYYFQLKTISKKSRSFENIEF